MWKDLSESVNYPEIQKELGAYIIGGPLREDRDRFTRLGQELHSLDSNSNTIISVACGAGEESLALAQNAGFIYRGYDISVFYAQLNPKLLHNQAHTEGSIVNLMVRREYGRDFTDVSDIDFLIHASSETLDRMSFNYGKEFDATSPVFWEQTLAPFIDDSILLFRHPDIKSHYYTFRAMLAHAIQTGRVTAITTSNPASLYFLLEAIESITEESHPNKIVSVNHIDFGSEYKKAREIFDDLTPEIVEQFRLGALTQEEYAARLAKISQTTHLDRQGNSVHIITHKTPEFARQSTRETITGESVTRNLDSWLITISHTKAA